MGNEIYPSNSELNQTDDEIIMDDEKEPIIIIEDDIAEEYEGNGDMEQELEMVDATDSDDASRVLCSAELSLHEGEPAYALAIHPSQEFVVSAGGNDKTAIFKIDETTETGLTVALLTELIGHKDTVEHAKFNSDGTMLATGGLDGTLRIHNVHDYQVAHVLEGPSEITWLEWHPRGPFVVAGSLDGTVWMWHVPTLQCMQVFVGNATTSTCGKFTSDGKVLVTGGDGSLFVWNPKEKTPLITYSGNNFPKENVISVAIHPTQPIAVAGFSEGSIAVVHLIHNQILSLFHMGEEPIEHVSFVSGLPIILAASLTGVLNIFDSNNFKLRISITHPEMTGITCCILLSNGMAAVGCLNGAIVIWDIRNGEQKNIFPLGTEDNVVYDIVELPRLKLLLASFDDGKVRIYRL